MEEKKEYLTEKNYNKGKKIIMLIAFLVLVVGLTIGGFLIYKGINEKQKIDNTTNEQAEKDKQRLKEIETEKEELNKKISDKKYECDSINMGTDSWFEKSNKCDNEVLSLEEQVDELESEEFDLENTDYEFDKKFNSVGSTRYFMFGVFIIIATLITSLSIFMFAKRREIMAFGMQQTMPLAQEGIEKMAPTVGNAAGTIAKDVAAGIKEGINSNQENK